MKFRKVIDKDAALHEMLSVIIVQSPAVRKLLKKIATWMDGITIRNSKDLDDIIEYISCLILGVANDEEILPYYQIINGSVDADKCDYLSRDSHATNVPVAVDIERLIHKLTLEEDSYHGQKSQIWNGDDNKKVYYLPAIKESAEEALNQLLMARTIMFKSVYYHQKVRTAEVMLRDIFAELNQLGVKETTNFYNILKTTDDFFGDNCYRMLEKRADGENDAVKKEISQFNEKLKRVTQKLDDLNHRYLLKRACAISNETIVADRHHKYFFQQRVLRLNDRNRLISLQERISEEYKNVCSLLEKECEEDRVFMIVEYPKYSPDHSKLDTRISYGNGQTQRASEVFQSETWMGSKDSRHKDHYLVTNCQSREIAFLALQKVLYHDYSVILTEKASVYSKVSIKEIRNQQKSLWQKEYYNTAAILISDILLKKHQSEIEEVAEKFQTYEGKGGNTVNEEKIRLYLEQFMLCEFSNHEEAEWLLDGILKMLRKALFINRRNFDDTIRELLAKINYDMKSLYICPLGGIKDSAKHMTYYFNDLNEVNPMRIKSSLQDILKERGKYEAIVFFDDGAYSGKQVISIFQEYMGIPIKERETQESHVKKLTGKEKEKLKQQKIILLYICFNREKEKEILTRLKELGLENVEIKFAFDMTEKVFSEHSRVFKNQNQKQIVQNYFSEIGGEILKTAKSDEDGKLKEKWTQKRIEEGKLGYNDAQQLVVLKSNVPTYTLTPIWLDGGKYMQREWIPLFDRTDKL